MAGLAFVFASVIALVAYGPSLYSQSAPVVAQDDPGLNNVHEFFDLQYGRMTSLGLAEGPLSVTYFGDVVDEFGQRHIATLVSYQTCRNAVSSVGNVQEVPQ